MYTDSPFEKAKEHDEWYQHIKNKQFKKFWKSHSKSEISDDCMHLLQGMLCYDPSQRLNTYQIMKDAWYNEKILSALALKKVIQERNA